tara:strand:+ start:2368 stop:3261 length:894 start_codon:yes stop_codon:yes gene_type:complete
MLLFKQSQKNTINPFNNIDQGLLDSIALKSRKSDYERYVLLGFSPFHYRQKLLICLAFNIEIAEISKKVSEPMLANIRYQWWRDALESSHKGEHYGHDLLKNLMPIFRSHDNLQNSLLTLIDGHEMEIEVDLPIDTNEIFNYAEKTGGILNQLFAEILLDDEHETLEVAKYYGTLWTIINVMKCIARKDLKTRLWLPEKQLIKEGVEPSLILDIKNREILCKIVKEVLLEGQYYLSNIPTRLSGNPNARSVLLLRGIIVKELHNFRKVNYDPFLMSSSIRPLATLVILSWWLIMRKY